MQLSGSSPFDKEVDKATADTLQDTDWGANITISDSVKTAAKAEECLRSVLRRLSVKNSRVQKHALVLLDSLVMNCGKEFHAAVASTEFIKESRLLLTEKLSTDELKDEFKTFIKKWAENEFKSDKNLSLWVSFFNALRGEGQYFGMGSSSKTTTAVTSSTPAAAPSSNSSSSLQKEEEDLRKAIALSLEESKKTTQPTSALYPTINSQQNPSYSAQPTAQTNSVPQPTPGKQAKALWDFEAAEDNELTFNAGEIVTIIDDSDSNWWKASSWRGEGLIPANFVTLDLSTEPESAQTSESSAGKSVQFNEEVEIQQFDPDTVEIDETVIDEALDSIQNADPTGLNSDDRDMLQLEEKCKLMSPLIDEQLQAIDKDHNELMTLHNKLMDAFTMYDSLMQQTAAPAYTQPATMYQPPVQPPQQPTQQPQQPVYQQTVQQPQQQYQQAETPSQPQYQLPTQPPQAVYTTYQPAAHAPDMSALLNQYQQVSGVSLQNLQYIPNTNQGYQQMPPQAAYQQ